MDFIRNRRRKTQLSVSNMNYESIVMRIWWQSQSCVDILMNGIGPFVVYNFLYLWTLTNQVQLTPVVLQLYYI